MENRGGNSSCAHMDLVQQRAERIRQSIHLYEAKSGDDRDRNSENTVEKRNSKGEKNTVTRRNAEKNKAVSARRLGRNEKGISKTGAGGRRTHRNRRREVRRRKRKLLIAAALVLAGVFVVRSEWRLRDQETAGGNWSLVQEWQETGNRLRLDGEDSESTVWQDELVLVNKDNKLPDGYEVELHWLNNGSCAVAEQMYGALQAMLTDGSTEGREFVVASGYRDSQTQQALLDEDIQRAMETGLTWQEAYDQETRETMPPGYSEHETGLAVDIVSLDYQVLDEGQELTEENRWLRENCSRYGFILRYPRGKEDITNIDYEAWHFRYVGEKAAKEIMERGITLEEYLEEQKSETGAEA